MPPMQDVLYTVRRRYQKFLDDSTPHLKERWLGTAILTFLYVFRTLYLHQFYVVMYATGIYLLNLLLAFLTPKFDPALSDENMLDNDDVGDAGGPQSGALPADALPKTLDDEFKPFIRRLPEFKFWFWGTRALLVAFACTFVPFLDVPVFWPILLAYFVLLFVVTMRRQIRHMVKYRYVPFDIGKKKYKESGPRVSQAAADLASSLLGVRAGDAGPSGPPAPPPAAGALHQGYAARGSHHPPAPAPQASLGGAYSLMTSGYAAPAPATTAGPSASLAAPSAASVPSPPIGALPRRLSTASSDGRGPSGGSQTRAI